MNGDKWYYVNPPSKTMRRDNARVKVSGWDYIPAILNRLFDGVILVFLVYLVYLLIMRQDILAAILTYGIR